MPHKNQAPMPRHLKWRYITKYESTDGTGRYVMVRDDRYQPGEANWVFVPRSCLPATLPENENERLPSPPAVTTTAASSITTTQATLNGSVNPNGIEATYYFEYGTSTSYGSSTYPGDAGTGKITEPESYPISGLQSGTTYHYRIVAYSDTGTSDGGDHTFTTDGPVEAVTGIAENIQLTGVTLTGTVNPRGYDAKYYFQYGESTSYGLSTSEGDAGTGTSPVPESASISGLLPVSIYHYRIVATSGGITSYGDDKTVTTQTVNHSPSVVYTPEGGAFTDAFYTGNNGILSYWYWDTTSGWVNGTLGSEIAPGTSPSVAREASSGYAFISYINKNSGVSYWLWDAESGWVNGTLGGEVAPGTSPSMVRQGNYTFISYVNKNHGVSYWLWDAESGWVNGTLGGEVAPGTSPSLVREASSGYAFISYINKNSGVSYWLWDAESGWVNGTLGGEVAPGTSPSMVRQGNYTFISYINKNSGVSYWLWDAESGWVNGTLGGEVAPGTSPSLVREASNGYTFIAYVNKSSGISYWYWSGKPQWENGILGGSVNSYSSPSLVREGAYVAIYYMNSGGGGISYWYWETSTGWVNGALTP